ncbi:hypothetical protein [Rubrolithibacter danxiaensis]|uniref:hypothetical protein n=1 Tax=Rubrolithibacter danxiaensis TaxID=3390805 RepID=UPI003BF7E12D
MKNFQEEFLNDQEDNLGINDPHNFSSGPGPDDDDWLDDDDDDDFDIETGDDIDDDADEELVNPNVIPEVADDDDDEEGSWADDDDDLLADDDEDEDDDLLASADDNDRSVTHDTDFNTDFANKPYGRTTGRMKDHEPGTPGPDTGI